MTKRSHDTDRLFVLTGAGVSAESGLPTFRGVNGLWRGYRVEDVATPEAFAADPAMVWQFYSERRQRHATVAAESRALCAGGTGARRSATGSSCARRMSIRCTSRRDRSAWFTCTAG